MEWLEADPLPVECRTCQEKDCYNCDAAGERWYLSQEDMLKLRRQGLVRAIERLKRKIRAIDMKLLPFTDLQRKALECQTEMTYDLFRECLDVCFHGGRMEFYYEIWNKYPKHAEELYKCVKRESDGCVEQENWERLKKRLIEEFGEAWVTAHYIDR